MAEENTDQSQKTEEPTQKKLDEARKKGQVANSREVNHWFMILGGTVIVMTFGPSMLMDFSRILEPFVAKPHDIPVDAANIKDFFGLTLADLGMVLMVPMTILVAAALLGGVVQNGLVISLDRIQPKLEKISLKSGFKKLFSLKAIAEFVKGLLKLAIVGTVATLLVMPEMSHLERMTTYNVTQVFDLIHTLAIRVMIGVLAILSIIAGLDFLYQKFEHTKSMRMSFQEIKDELKQTEGDPMVKGRLRQIRLERARRRMMAAVPESSVVITNPTHFAIALKYELDDMAAPLCVAKGADSMALRIREVAKEHGIPIVENPPLARALHAGVEIDQEIPEEHYRAVAEIIGYVMRLKGKLPAQSPS